MWSTGGRTVWVSACGGGELGFIEISPASSFGFDVSCRFGGAANPVLRQRD
jgi:hypothetical protein